MGNWNAHVGEGTNGEIVGKYALGRKNERGNGLIEFCVKQAHHHKYLVYAP